VAGRYRRASGLAAALERALPRPTLFVHGLWNMTGSAAVPPRAAGRPAVVAGVLQRPRAAAPC
jgi:hypothetical protein